MMLPALCSTLVREFHGPYQQRAAMASVLSIKSNAVERPAADASFDPYCRLLRMLMPSLRSVVVHDGFANLVWSSDEWDMSDALAIIKDAIANALSDTGEFAGVARTIDADRVVYSFAVRGEQVDLLGVISLVVRLSGTQIEARPLQTVRQLVQPALECLRREMLLRLQLGSRERDLDIRERDLDLMLEMSSKQSEATSDADEFSLILRTGLERAGCALAALWVPDKNVSMSLTRSGQPMAPEPLKRAQHHLMAWMQLQQRIIVVNHISKVASVVAAPYKILACPIRHRSERVMGVLAMFNPPSAPDFDVQQTRIAELLAKRATNIIQAQYDASTGLMTRQAFERQATAMLGPAGTGGDHVILYLDIDRLHVINETFGMHVGDDVIVSVAACMAKSLPPGALSARISGDRLAALIPNSSMDAAQVSAEQIRVAAEAIAPRAGQGSFEVSVCVGVAPIQRSDNPLAHALATAEIACKAAKDRGRNRVEMFQDSDHSIIRRHTDILVVGQLRHALDHDRFRLDAQPILPLRANYGRPRFELLIRMLGDRGEIIPPGKFLSSAERYQLMPAVDRWVVRRACELLGKHTAAGEDGARFAINLSGQSLQDDSFLPFVIDKINETGVPASALCFELTETATIGNLAKAQNFMRVLQDLGCQFALDDFGTGVSSLAYLRDLSVNYLKIDGSFVRDAVGNARSESMIKAIAQLAKVMCMETIAEYVETDALRVRMADLGVDYGQGFAMGKAQGLEDLLEELAVYEATVSNWAVSEEAVAAAGKRG
jgi:diguanylate cyclase (GGDEF)-like protein